MSNSRLEKFIYAICSMDVSDLPVPLSRIEKLWNCLITGEIPDFEPQSRNEKYLMAMLDRYDISNLPAPMSRGEKLLYKIAVGETDLSDVPGYLSRYEELLKYLIENGGISGGDFEYVLYTFNQSLYTLYMTAEKPVKSAILKGLTLVNLSENLNTITRRLDFWYTDEMLMDNIEKLKRNTYYTVLYRLENLNGNHENYNGNEVGIGKIGYEKNLPPTDIQTELDKNGGWCKIKFQLTDSLMSEYPTYKHLYIRPIRRSTTPVESETIEYTIRGFAILEGDYITNPIPFNKVFEGMQSVQAPSVTMTGKNLWDNKNFVNGVIDGESVRVSAGDLYDTSFYFNFKENQQYVFTLTSYSENKKLVYFIYNYTDGTNSGYTNFLPYNGETKSFISSANKTILYISFVFSDNDNYTLSNVQLEEGSVATAYEPYKSNILTAPEDLESRGIGDVQDTLNCLTGEVTERIGEVVLVGSENWNINYQGNSDLITFSLNKFPTNIAEHSYTNCKNFLISDSLPIITDYKNNKGILSHRIEDNHWVVITVNRSDLISEDVVGFKHFLSTNPVTIQYQLATESIKTVDLTVVDQDGQPTQLGTFENVTHVSLESAGLIPEVEMEVATNLLEDTVFNLTDAFNTLYPTAEKPVVDGTLYGQTLVNCLKSQSGSYNDYQISSVYNDLTLFKPNTLYTFINNWDKGGTLAISDNNGQIINVNFAKNSSTLFTTPSSITNVEIYSVNGIHGGTPSDCEKWKTAFIVIDGDYTNVDIPYFEGMQSVQTPGITMTGKNLFDGVSYIDGFIANPNNYTVSPDTDVTSIIFNVNKNTDYILSAKTNFNRSVIGGSVQPITINTKITKIEGYRVSNTLKFNSGEFTNIIIYLNSSKIDIEDIQVEEGSVATPYEPYKSITLSTPSDLELRKVGEVQDEVNVMTGEVTECIGEFILNGSEYWDIVNDTFRTAVINDKVIKLETQADRDKIVISCDRYPSRTYNDPWLTSGGNFISLTVGKDIVINDSSFTDIKGFKQYLSQNPLTIKFVLETPTTKTVDLSIVNQDGNETKLRTFDDTTHVLLHSEAGPNPSASLTVRTKIPSGSSTSLLMDDISTKQEQLNTMVDEQSNNVDAIMVATTEIYEETL